MTSRQLLKQEIERDILDLIHKYESKLGNELAVDSISLTKEGWYPNDFIIGCNVEFILKNGSND